MLETIKHTLGKKERICGTKRIEVLFSAGNSFVVYPLRIVYTKRDKADTPVSMMVSVPKKRFKRAVKRNRVKRLIREAFRLNKKEFALLSEKYNTGLDIVFLFLRNELPEYKEIETAIMKTASQLEKKLNEQIGE